MGQLEDLQRNRIVRAQNIQKGFCDNDIEKAHQEGDIHPNGKWVWTKLPSGKYDWRVRKGQTKTAASAPAKPSGNDTGVDIAKIPNEEFKRITQTLEKKNPDHRDAERYLEEEAMSDKELKNFHAVAEHFKNSSKINKLTQEYCRKWAELAEQEMQYRKKDKTSKQGDDKSKVNQATKQQAKSASSSDIEQERQEQIANLKKSVSDATSDIQKLFDSFYWSKINLNVRLSEYGDYSLGIRIGDKSWDSISLDMEKRLRSNKSDDFEIKFNHDSTSYDFNDPNDVKNAQIKFHCGNIIAQNIDKIKKIFIKHGAAYASAKHKLNELDEELKAK